jgi:rod shape-determining protein MreB
MINMFIKSIPALKKRLFTPSLRMVICIPSGITEVEMRAVKESAERVNGKEVYLIHEPMAAAIGIGVDIMQPKGNMIVDIGGGTTEIAVIALGGIVCDKSVKIAGDVFTNDIIYYMRTEHNLYVGETTAEKIKIQIGAAIEDLDAIPEEMSVQGRDLLTGKPKQIDISHREIAKALDKSIQRVEDAIMETLSQTPPELAADIYNTGIYLAGGGSMLRGLDKRISLKTDLPVYIAEDPLRAVVRGTGIALKDIQKYKSILIK